MTVEYKSPAVADIAVADRTAYDIQYSCRPLYGPWNSHGDHVDVEILSFAILRVEIWRI